MTPSDLVVQQHLRRYQSDCALARQKLLRAQTVTEMVRAADVSAPAWLRSLIRREASVLNQEAERRLDTLVDAQSKDLRMLSGEQREARLAQLRRDWEPLRGHFPRLAVKTQRVLMEVRNTREPGIARGDRSPCA